MKLKIGYLLFCCTLSALNLLAQSTEMTHNGMQLNSFYNSTGMSMMPAHAGTQATYYVSPTGNDRNRGTMSSPFLTLTKARDVVRKSCSKMRGDIYVYLRGGTYPITSTLQLDARDSASNGYSIYYKAYPGETPELNGAIQATNWALHDSQKNIYRSCVGTNLDTRQLFVDGIRANRASGGVAFGSHDRTTVRLPASGFGSDMANWGNVSQIEILDRSASWCVVRYLVSSISRDVVTMSSGYKLQGDHSNMPYQNFSYVENAYELLDTPGEFYLNTRTGYLYYMPRPGENMTTSTFLVPRCETLVSVAGEYGKKINNIVFDGLKFAYNTWLLPNKIGFVAIQVGGWLDESDVYSLDGHHGSKTPGALDMKFVSACTVKNCTFTHTGMSGVNVSEGSSSLNMTGNTFSDIGGDGITIGNLDRYSHHEKDPVLLVKDNLIQQNTITTVGADYGGNVGICVGFAKRTIVQHNTLYNLPYTGISVGFGWGDDDESGPLQSGNHIIRYNRIYDYLKGRSDGGGIYTLGKQVGTAIYNNYVSQQRSGGNHIYLDNGSAYIHVYSNLVLAAGGYIGNGVENEGFPLRSNQTSKDRYGTGSHDNSFSNNYYDQAFPYQTNTVGWIVWSGNTAVDPTNLPAGATAIAKSAGAGNNDGCPTSTPAPAATPTPSRPTPRPMIVDDDSPSVTYSGTWTASFKQAMSLLGRTAHSSTNNGDSFQFTFIGTGVSFVGDGGLIDMYIDNTFDTQVNASRVHAYQAPSYTKTGLAAGTHTIKGVVARGGLRVDAFMVMPQVTQTASTPAPPPTAPSPPTPTPIPTGMPVNLALLKDASQSSLYHAYWAGRANDGDTDPVFEHGSVNSTEYETNAWWMVDLDADYSIGNIVIWNRGFCQGRLSNYNVYVLDAASKAVYTNHQTTCPDLTTTVNVGGVTGRYVKIQLNGAEYLHMAEVQVFPASVSPASPNPATHGPITNSEIISITQDATALEHYAAKELQRYLYQVSGTLPPIRVSPSGGFVLKQDKSLKPQQYRLTCDGKRVTIAGGDETGVLYGVYGLLEDHYGVSFLMSGDVLPETKILLHLGNFDETKMPRQAIRGFTSHWCYMQGAGLWSLEDWKFHIDQMARMRLNMLSIHNYIFEGYRENWLNWGTFKQKNLNQNSAQSAYYHVCSWPLREYPGRSADLLDDYAFGCAASLHAASLSNKDVWERCASTFQQIIAHAHRRGVKVALGTEFHKLNPTEQMEISESMLAWYPDLDYLVYYRHENTKEPPFVQSMYTFFRQRAPKMGHVLTGWGELSDTNLKDVPADVVAGPFTAYSDTFENGSRYGQREYWAGPWLEEDNKGDMHYMPWSKNLANTISSYAQHATNMNGIVTLTWRLTDVIDPRLFYIAAAPWVSTNTFTTSRAVYLEYARRCYGAANAEALAGILDQNEAFPKDPSDCRMSHNPKEIAPVYDEGQVRKADAQLVVIDSCLDKTTNRDQKQRLQWLRNRILGAKLHMQLPVKDNLWDLAEAWSQSYLDRTMDMSTLGQLVSNHQMVMQHFVIKEQNDRRAGQRVKYPSQCVARQSASGVKIAWRNEEPAATGFNVYRNDVKLNAAPLSATAVAFTHKTTDVSGRFRISALAADGTESQHGAPVTVDTNTPRVVVISPPTTAIAGQPLDLEARVSSGFVPEDVSAELQYRCPGAKRWLHLPMNRRCRAIFAARIPASAVTPNGIEYTIVANAGGRKSSYPVTAPEFSAFVSVESVMPQSQPSAPASLTVDADGKTVHWSAAAGDVFWYRLYRGKESRFTPGRENFLTYVYKNTLAFRDCEPDFEDRPLSGVYYYRVTAVDRFGNESLPAPAAALTTIAGGQAQAQNIIAKPGFETGLISPWVYVGDAGNAIVGSNFGIWTHGAKWGS